MSVREDFGLHVSTHLHALQTLRGGVPDGLPAQLAEIAPILKTFETRVEEIGKDEKLSPLGKIDQLKAAVAAATGDVEKWRAARTTGLDAQLEGQRHALQAAAEKLLPKPTDVQVQHMIQRLAGFDQLEVEVLYFDASDSERRVIEEAAALVGRQPVRQNDQLVWAPLISQERIDTVREARIERANPSGAAALQDLQRIRNTFDFLAGSATGLLKEAVTAE